MNKWKYKIMLLLLLLLCSVAMLVVDCSREELQSDGMADGWELQENSDLGI